MILVPFCSCLCPIYWSHVLSREWRCSWSSADRRCSNYIWVIDNLIANKGASYIRDLTVLISFQIFHFREISMFYFPNGLFLLLPNHQNWFLCDLMKNYIFPKNFISYHIFAMLPWGCRSLAVDGARLPSVDGLAVRCTKCITISNLPSQCICYLFQICLR